MDAATMKEILRKQYGINNEHEFNLAVKNSKGINIGIFTMPLNESEQVSETEGVA